MDTTDFQHQLSDPPILTTTTTTNSNNDPRVSTEEELQFEFLKSKFELEVYKGKLKDIQDVVVKPQTPFDFGTDSAVEEEKLVIVDLRNELEIYGQRIQELESEREDKISFLKQTAASIDTVNQCVSRMLQMLNDEDIDDAVDVNVVAVRMTSTSSLTQRVLDLVKLAGAVERNVRESHEMRKRERKQLENSVVSLTEENRDINTLLRVALVEKENVEKSLNRLKGNSTEAKRVPLLQFAERGLHKVGFSFMMASAQTEQVIDSSTVSTASSKSDGSDYDEEIVSLVCI